MLDPQGKVLCNTEFKKARWYVTKGLAKIVEETSDSLIVQLTFEPNRKENNDIEDDFYI